VEITSIAAPGHVPDRRPWALKVKLKPYETSLKLGTILAADIARRVEVRSDKDPSDLAAVLLLDIPHISKSLGHSVAGWLYSFKFDHNSCSSFVLRENVDASGGDRTFRATVDDRKSLLKLLREKCSTPLLRTLGQRARSQAEGKSPTASC